MAVAAVAIVVEKLLPGGETFARAQARGWKESKRIAVRSLDIVVGHTSRRRLRVRDLVSVRIRDLYEGPEAVTCVIPGHERVGEELVADELVIEDGPLAAGFRGSCGYGATFGHAG